MAYMYKKNMKFCRSCTEPGGKCHGQGRCNFAHSIKEVRPDLCPYGRNCRARHRENRPCGYIHEGETKEDYANRQGFCERRKMLNKPNTKHKGIQDLTALEYALYVITQLEKYEAIDSYTNKGALIMKKWGWEEGMGLGKNLDGLLLPLNPPKPSKTMICEKARPKGPLVPVEFIKACI